jgi:hypothetical protein
VSAAAALALCGCGGGETAHRASPPAPSIALTDCGDWREMRPATRDALITQLGIFFGARVNGKYGHGQTLSHDQALQVLTNGCRPAYAGAVKLYKLYGRAAAFTP